MIAEFFLDDTFCLPWPKLYETLRTRGYAGALGWQWFNAYAGRSEGARQWPRILQSARTIATPVAN